MRKIKRIVLHSTSGWNTQSTQSIKDYWKNDLKWKEVGYHKLISNDGTIEDLAPLSTITNGVQGYNSDSVHICYKGGLKEITKDGKYIYGDGKIESREWVKVCPTFDAMSFDEYGWIMGTKALQRVAKGRKFY